MPVEGNTVYKCSYPCVSAEVARMAKPEMCKADQGPMKVPGLIDGHTTTSLSFQYPEGSRVPPCRPFGSNLMGKGPMEDLTTQKVDFPAKPYSRRDAFQDPRTPFSDSPMAGLTTYRLCFAPHEGAQPAHSMKPVVRVQKLSCPVDCLTTQKMSYVQPHAPPKEEFPWAQKGRYHRPCVPFAGFTTYTARVENGATELSPMVSEDCPPALPPRGLAKKVPAENRASREVRLPTRVHAVNRRGVIAQCLVAGALIIMATGAGCPIGFSSVLLPQLQADNSTLPTDDDKASWIASIHSAATPVGTLLSGPLMERIGRNAALQVSCPIMTAGWIVLALAKNHAMVLGARVLCGFSVGLMAAPVQVLLGETTEPRLRGLLIGAPFVSYSGGILLVFLLGSLLPWRVVSGLATVPGLLALVALRFLPESPVWLLHKGRLREAQRALDWLRGGVGSVQSKVEMDQLVMRTQAEKERDASNSLWQVFISPRVIKPLVIMNLFNLTQLLSGTYIVIFYAVDLLGGVLPASMDAQLVAVFTAAVRLVMSVGGCVALLGGGRRPLALTSALLTALAALCVGLMLQLGWSDSGGYLACSLLLLYVAANSIGMFLLPGIMLGELLPARARGLGGALTLSVFNLTLFVFTKAFPFIKATWGSAGIFWLFSASAVLNALTVLLFLPETAGRSLGDIEDYFTSGRWLWHRRPRRRPPSELLGLSD